MMCVQPRFENAYLHTSFVSLLRHQLRMRFGTPDFSTIFLNDANQIQITDQRRCVAINADTCYRHASSSQVDDSLALDALEHVILRFRALRFQLLSAIEVVILDSRAMKAAVCRQIESKSRCR